LSAKGKAERHDPTEDGAFSQGYFGQLSLPATGGAIFSISET
jgi:hypothetical protein